MYMYRYSIPYLIAFQYSLRLSALRKNFLKVTVYIECFAADEDILTHILFLEHMPDEVLATQMHRKNKTGLQLKQFAGVLLTSLTLRNSLKHFGPQFDM